MAGIYIHIPYCKKKCNYCNFYSTAYPKNIDDYINAVLKEIELQKKYLENENIKTIYFGGGTPSLLGFSDINKIISKLHAFFKIDKDAEITIEANPDDLTNEKYLEFKKSNINRISIGVQSFHDDDLKYLNRNHNSQQITKSIQLAQDNGFDNISIDLIYGIPTLTNQKWIDNLNKILSLNIPHISAYSLTVEPNTILANHISKGKTENLDENKAIEQFEILINFISINDLIHYEISNFCKQGFISKHNSNYWKGEKYLGIGASAHSFNGFSRQWNISNNTKYIDFINKSEIPFEKEILSLEQKYNEYILTSLRTIWGIEIEYIKNNFGLNFSIHFIKESSTFIEHGYLAEINNKIVLTNKGKFIADKITSNLFF